MDILLRIKPHYIKNSVSVILFFIILWILIFVIWGMDILSSIGFYFLIGSSFILIINYLALSSQILTIDKEKTIFKTGILSKKTNDIKHIDIKRIDISQFFVQRILGIGDVSIFTGGDKPEITIRGVEEYNKVKNLLNEQRKNNEQLSQKNDPKKSIDIDIAEKMKKLKELKDKDLISEEEYEEKKKDLLDRI